MGMSILIAKILSIGYLSLGLGILINPNYYKKELIEMLDNSTMLLYGGLLSIVLGSIIIHYHNTWNSDWTMVITIIGWMALIKGVSLIVYPQFTSFFKENFFHPKNTTRILIPLLLLLGLVFGYFGFVK